MLYLDIETRSQCDLIFHGLRRYAEDLSTECVCIAYCFDDEPIQFWWMNEPFPDDLREYLEGDGPIMAHNAQFERELFDFVVCPTHDLPPIPHWRWRCSMVTATTNGHPAGLAELGASLHLPVQKQPAGTRLIREYCAPNFKDILAEDEDKELFKDYCIHDVEVMRAAVKAVRPLTDEEWAEYHLTEKMNDKGIPVDIPLAKSVLRYSDDVREDSNAIISEITGGKMTRHTQRKERDNFILPRLTDNQLKLITVYKDGVQKLSFDQDHRGYLLDDPELDPDVRELLEAIDGAGTSSLKKFAVAAHTHSEGLVHHTLQFHGAQTGRYTSRGLQIHNMKRDAFTQEEADELADDIINNYEIDRPSKTMARLARSVIKSDDGIYFVDWSAIEGRVAPWLSDNPHAEKRLDVFREGGDIYVASARAMFPGQPIDDTLRQCGKVAELSLGYGGAVGALTRMAKNYGITFAEQEARNIVQKWRDTNLWAVDIWRDFEDAALYAVQKPGTAYDAGRCSYQSDGNYLWCALPSGRFLAYPYPDMEWIEGPYGDRQLATYQLSTKPKKDAEGRTRRHLRGAVLFQNAVQATAASILREALLAADAEGLDIRLHCHDEIVGFGPREDGEKLNEIMLRVPSWAGNSLPLATGGVKWQTRYGK